MAAYNQYVQEAFFLEINELAGLNGWHVSWPNVDFTPDGAEYVKVELLPAIPSSAGFDITNYPGIFQVSVNYRDGTGSTKAIIIADEIIDFFYRNKKLSSGGVCLVINSQPYISPPIISGGWVTIPVTIPYRFIKE